MSYPKIGLHKKVFYGNDTKVIFYSDRGVQYASRLTRSLLTALNVKQSMSRKENGLENT